MVSPFLPPSPLVPQWKVRQRPVRGTPSRTRVRWTDIGLRSHSSNLLDSQRNLVRPTSCLSPVCPHLWIDEVVVPASDTNHLCDHITMKIHSTPRVTDQSSPHHHHLDGLAITRVCWFGHAPPANPSPATSAVPPVTSSVSRCNHPRANMPLHSLRAASSVKPFMTPTESE